MSDGVHSTRTKITKEHLDQDVLKHFSVFNSESESQTDKRTKIAKKRRSKQNKRNVAKKAKKYINMNKKCTHMLCSRHSEYEVIISESDMRRQTKSNVFVK